MGIESHIEAIAEGIVSKVVNIEEAENTTFGELVNLYRVTKGYHTAHRNLHLDYSDARNWCIAVQQVLLEYQVQSSCACFAHSSYRMPSLLGPQHDMQYRSVSVIQVTQMVLVLQ